MTPSAAHNAAYRRPGSHVRLQSEVASFLRTRTITHDGAIPPHREVEVERPILRNGQVIAFADLCETVTVNLATTVHLFEIKPVIHTVAGIVRQCKALLALAERFIPADVHLVSAIVPCFDPLLGDLRAEWPQTWAWDAEFEVADDWWIGMSAPLFVGHARAAE